MIEVSDLTKRFGGVPALDRLTLTVPQGSVYGLVGPNGAGKTTVIRHMTGILRPDSGSVCIDGLPVYENRAVKSRLAFIPDELYAPGSVTLHEMVRFWRGIYPRFDMERFQALRDVFQLSETKPFRQFSKGMQKQAMFWLAICVKPDYLILDEPVDGLDPVMRRQIWSLILDDVAESGTTVLVSSHNLRELEDVCDRVGVMHRGRMLLERSLAELQDNVVKAQLVTENPLPEGLKILHSSMTGRIQTLILRGRQREVADLLAQCHPMLCDLLPLSLEEVFIYELGGVDYDVKNIVL
jgi:ABC-2 type transport system ATP-binding protein